MLPFFASFASLFSIGADLQERLGLQALGYRKVLYCELFCIRCGDWRGVLEEEQENYNCPLCQRPSKISILCEKAFTRQPAIPWEQVAKPFAGMLRHEDEVASIRAAAHDVLPGFSRVRQNKLSP